MHVIRTSSFTGIEHTRDLDITPEQLHEYMSGKKLLQDAFPHLPPEDREFIKTGITPEEWKKYVNDDEPI
jgi:hypothetical protein